MLISATLISHPRKVRYCGDCRQKIDGETLRLYGAAESDSKPYAMYLHPTCTTWKHPKILMAMKQHRPLAE